MLALSKALGNVDLGEMTDQARVYMWKVIYIGG